MKKHCGYWIKQCNKVLKEKSSRNLVVIPPSSLDSVPKPIVSSLKFMLKLDVIVFLVCKLLY